MRNRTLLYKFFVLLFIFAHASLLLYAQPGDPGGDPDVPISGIELLIAAGGVLGAKKFFNRKKK